MKLELPALSLVALVGPSGCGKSTFAARHFKPTEVLSSDFCRGLASDDENDQAATKDAFEILYFIARKRLAAGRLVVVDATNVRAEDRKRLIDLAREYHVVPVAIVFEVPEAVCHERNASRPNRDFGRHVVRQQAQSLRRSLRDLGREGFRRVTILKTQEEIDALTIERVPLWVDRRSDSGPFDIIGDVHGCHDELVDLLTRLGYVIADGGQVARHPEGRKAVFLGDLVDRGPGVPSVLRLAMRSVGAGTALCVPGNHDIKLMRKLRGRDVRITHGLAESLEQLEREPQEFRGQVAEFLDGLISHYVLDGGRLVVAHAGLKEDLQGRASGKVRDFALFGETSGETDEFGLPVRYNWAADYRGAATVVYGHTPVPEPVWLNRTICIDTGCVYGGRLTALRWPEKELVHVEARRMYYEPSKPIVPMGTGMVQGAPAGEAASAERRPYDDLLDIDDVTGKRVVTTRIQHTVTIREENAIAALEVMSRFAIDPHWLIFLPPTMAPPDTCKTGDLLEHPREVFSWFRHQGVPRVICEEKHMGSRAVLVVCRDGATARRRFGVASGDGAIYTRTGRPFFPDPAQEAEVLDRVRAAMQKADLWTRLATDWICLDAETMPWSAKAQELLRRQYAPAGASARASLRDAVEALRMTADRPVDADAAPVRDLRARYESRREAVERYVEAYGRYCWPVTRVADLKIAPFHVLAGERRVYTDQDHPWHLETSPTCAAPTRAVCSSPPRSSSST